MMASSYIILHMIYLLSLITSVSIMADISATDASDAANPTKLVLPLIHRDSLPSITLGTDDVRVTVVPDKNSLFLVNFSIGEPPVPQLLAMDTGSPLIWVHCSSCIGCIIPAQSLVYDPKTSSTYTKLSCGWEQYNCVDYYDYAHCSLRFECAYTINYVDRSRNNGTLAFEKFTFATSDDGIHNVANQVFGCGLESRGTVSTLSGILGLQLLNQHSLVSRVGKKFSYCIGNISDPGYLYNQLILGDGAVTEGYSTPMRIEDGNYVVRLEGIAVGDKQLKINQQEFDFNLVIDSGTTLTELHRSVFEQLKEEVANILDGVVEPARSVISAGDRPCYWGNLRRDLKGFPLVTLQLAEGTDLALDVEGMFHRLNDSLFCMAIDVSNDDENILGIFSQQYYNVGFDLNSMKVSFQSIECDLLED